MATLYQALKGIHNLVGGVTLLATLVAGGILLATARTTGGRTPLALRAAILSASLQGLLGILLIVIALVAFGAGYVVSFWPHYVLGLASVALVSVLTGQARRAPDSAARRYGGALLGVAVVVVIAYWIGMTQS